MRWHASPGLCRRVWQSCAYADFRPRRASAPASGHLYRDQRRGRASSCLCCASGTAPHLAPDGPCASGRRCSRRLFLLLPEPGDDIIGVIPQMPPDSAAFRADAEITPLVKRGLGDTEVESHLLDGPEAIGRKLHWVIASPSI